MKKSKLDALMESAEDLASLGLKSEDKAFRGPMTLGKKIAIALGVVMLGVFVYLLITVLRRPAEQAEKIAPPAKLVEIVPKGFKVDKNKELEVVEMEFIRKEPREIVGTLRNLTDRRFAKCEVSFDVTTRSGSQLGGAATTVNDVAPHASVRFRIPVPYENASFVMVRELRPE